MGTIINLGGTVLGDEHDGIDEGLEESRQILDFHSILTLCTRETKG